MPRTASALLLGTALLFAAGAAAAEPVVYGPAHVEAALSDALSAQIPAGRLHLELDNRAVELRANDAPNGLRVENLHYSPVQGRFAAELVVPGAQPPARLPVAGRAWGMVEVPVLTRRVSPGDSIGGSDVAYVEVRAEQAGTDVAGNEAQLVGMTPKRGVPPNQPVRLRDIQSPRIVDKGSLVTITLSTPIMTLTTQGKALQEGGRGDVIRVLNTQSNRIVEATVAGPNVVAVAKPGAPVLK